jgi:hypothetical protein
MDQCMSMHDQNYANYPDRAKPPNVIQRIGLYREFILSMSEQGIGESVGGRLPRCVVDGVFRMFPDPVFMGAETTP